MNFLLAVGITAFLLTRGIVEPTTIVHIEKVSVGSPAEKIGLRAGDVVSSISFSEKGKIVTKELEDPGVLIETVKAHAGETVTLLVVRGGEKVTYSIVPRKTPPAGEGPLGVTVTNLEKKIYPASQAPFFAVTINMKRIGQMFTSLAGLLAKLVMGQPIPKGEVSGPVGIAQVTGEAVKYGWEAVLEFMSILSLNLALLNILPFPALDGGRLAFVVADKFGRKARPAVERAIHQAGMIILLALLLLITVNDILRIVRG
jgi:regulator of sigma E protease